MKQIVLNDLVIFVIPFLLGALVRFLLRRRSKAWLVTAVAACLALAAGVVAMTVPNHGSELYGLRLLQAVCFLFGSLFMGAAIRFLRRKK